MNVGKAGSVVVLLALVPSAYTAWRFRDMPHFGHFHDDSAYFVCAKSIAEGKGYRLLSFPGEPHETKYPPLYPVLLANGNLVQSGDLGDGRHFARWDDIHVHWRGELLRSSGHGFCGLERKVLL